MRLFTSIKAPAPEEIPYLRECLDSWRASGFVPVTVNGPAEIAVLRELDLPVDFASMPSDGKPRIGSILSAIRNSGEPFAGIINSDCRVMGYPGLADTIRKGLDQTCILAWRVNVGENIAPSATSHGFDAYFFDAKFLPEDDFGFSIGDCWWDYWFPLACEMQGARLQTLVAPLLTHRAHPANWNSRQWEAGASRFWGALRSWKPADPPSRSLFSAVPRTWWCKPRLSAANVATLSLIVPAWFHKARSQQSAILPPEMAHLETMLALSGAALINMADFTVFMNMLKRVIPALRLTVAVFRRARWWLRVSF